MSHKHYAKYIKSEYKHVHGSILDCVTYWMFIIRGETRQTYKTEREAAIAADKYLISVGKKPVNILVKK